jgi:hypothetical protein
MPPARFPFTAMRGECADQLWTMLLAEQQRDLKWRK